MNKKTNLILDPLQHSPGSFLLFEDCDYWTLFHPAVPEEPFYRDRPAFEAFFGFKPKTLADLAESYDRVFIVLPMYAVVGADRPHLFKELLSVLYKIVDSKKPSKVAFFDTHDNPYVPLEYLDKSGYKCDAIFKANYRAAAQPTYDDRVKSFPFFCFGPIEPMWVTLSGENTRSQHDNAAERNASCYWGAGAGGCFVAGTRPDIEPRIQEAISYDRDRFTDSPVLASSIVKTPQLGHQDFMTGLKTHRSFLVLNGSGKVHRRFFEGVSVGCLGLLEKNDVIYPAEVEAAWKDRAVCTFSTPEELRDLIARVASPDGAFYREQLANQTKFRNTILTKSWLAGYIEKSL